MADSQRPAEHILITGATGGIGKAMAEQLVREGANVYVTGRDNEKLKALVDHLDTMRREGQTILPFCFDIGHLTKVKDAMTAISKLPLDTVIFNAGVMFPSPRAVHDDNHPALEDTIKVNVLGHFVMARHLVRDREEREGDRVLPHLRFVVISSTMANHASQYLTRWPREADSFNKFFSRHLFTSDGWLSYMDSKLGSIVMAQHLNEKPNTSAVAIYPGVASTEIFSAMPWVQRKLLSWLPASWRPTMENVDTVANRVIGEAVRSNGIFDGHWICDGTKVIPTNVDTTQKDKFMRFIEHLTDQFM
ncbi:hypothetical protein PENTCL1PPCAC_22157 [Pristionchus entomophagus]|uniref:Dehydrogenase n=1 Tax=Pristionchus entomophagus TaxID=358040 RepID=A0AAV5U0J4_9BILA|nr:hypothetical protein PENTCL1PPCAC_22157 [Pristionchus entomophagus]